jgi:hypothetical protein
MEFLRALERALLLRSNGVGRVMKSTRRRREIRERRRICDVEDYDRVGWTERE